jgi:hypothetical protein
MKNKQVVRPQVTLKVYDSETKKPLEDVVLTIKDSTKGTSNTSGRIVVERKKDYLGNNHQIALRDSVFVLSKNNYKDVDFNYVKYFDIKLISDLKNSYFTDSIFMNKK